MQSRLKGKKYLVPVKLARRALLSPWRVDIQIFGFQMNARHGEPKVSSMASEPRISKINPFATNHQFS